jgi:hypothetical protein
MNSGNPASQPHSALAHHILNWDFIGHRTCRETYKNLGKLRDLRWVFRLQLSAGSLAGYLPRLPRRQASRPAEGFWTHALSVTRNVYGERVLPPVGFVGFAIHRAA